MRRMFIVTLLGVLIVATSDVSYGLPRSGDKLKTISTWWQAWQQSNPVLKASTMLMTTAAFCTILSCASSYQKSMSMSVYEEKMGRISAFEAQQEQERQLLHERLLKQDYQLLHERRQKGLEFDFAAYRERILSERQVEIDHWQDVLSLARREDISGSFYFTNNPYLPPRHLNPYYAVNKYGDSIPIDREWHPVPPLYKIPDPPYPLDYIVSLGVDREDFSPELLDYPHLYLGKLITFIKDSGSAHIGIVYSYNYDNPSRLVVANTVSQKHTEGEPLTIITTDQVSGILFNENYVDGDSDPNSESLLNRGYANYNDSLHTGRLLFTRHSVEPDWYHRLIDDIWVLDMFDDTWLADRTRTKKILGTAFWLNFSDGYRLVEVSHVVPFIFPPSSSVIEWDEIDWSIIGNTDVLIHTDNLITAPPNDFYWYRKEVNLNSYDEQFFFGIIVDETYIYHDNRDYLNATHYDGMFVLYEKNANKQVGLASLTESGQLSVQHIDGSSETVSTAEIKEVLVVNHYDYEDGGLQIGISPSSMQPLNADEVVDNDKVFEDDMLLARVVLVLTDGWRVVEVSNVQEEDGEAFPLETPIMGLLNVYDEAIYQ